MLGRNYKGCTTYGDFRDLVNRKDIDAVDNCTPDHWHVIPAIMAAKAGKDVICEKPLTLTVAEGRILSKVVQETGRIFQTASENRSIDTYIHLCELVRNGRIGKLRHIEVTLPIGSTTRGENFTQRDVQPVPKGFNYEMWLGQAPLAPYCPARCHGSFRWNLDYSGGTLTDWGAHMIDLAQWGNDTEKTGPVEVEGKGDFPPRDALFNVTPDVRPPLQVRKRRHPARLVQPAGHPLSGERRLGRLRELARPLAGERPEDPQVENRPQRDSSLPAERSRRPHRGRQRG